ncbi:uncharacterized protein LOC121398946 isoform X2 [Xenopus laevis]|uniref:Uncharacterized protein LOC121398946 isoform X2 n=1 Tax=Xenopus laevis TaxID=8355 RepID=A0A8J1LYD9_XENLA|nr:uncharacterized protein LOC121398946 isoform X2 [Xenopus laevis]
MYSETSIRIPESSNSQKEKMEDKPLTACAMSVHSIDKCGGLTNMHEESERYESFILGAFPAIFQQKQLSQAGFYYVGPGDRVRCFSCGGELDAWEPWDVPLTRHRISFPDCPYVWEQSSEGAGAEDHYKVRKEYNEKLLILKQAPAIHFRMSCEYMSDQEHIRLETYRGHGKFFFYHTPLHLAREGYNYVGPGDRVQCFSCEGELEAWERWDVPLTRHRHSFPDCPYVRELRASRGHTEDQYQLAHFSHLNNPLEKPLEDMSDEYSRLETYRGHSIHFLHIKPLQLAQAGFYFVGLGDRVRCFSCRGELEKWEKWDVPLTRHRLSLFNCPYVRELTAKGAGLEAQYQECTMPPLNMSDENKRRETYRGHSQDFLNECPLKLAKEGFYYVGPGDLVQCFSCGGELQRWEEEDLPLTRHEYFFPNCLCVRELRAKKTCKIFDYRERTWRISDIKSKLLSPCDSKIEAVIPLWDMNDQYSREETYCLHRDYFSYNSPLQLAQAGFYYLGPEDRVRCFSCGGELERWEDWDVPLTRHLHFFHNCPYALQQSAKRTGAQIQKQEHTEPITIKERVVLALQSSSNSHRMKSCEDMSVEYNRLDTYRGRRGHFFYKNQLLLAHVGFYYVGPGDRVRCFSCGGELEKWDYWDDPLTRHLHSFPDCTFVWEQSPVVPGSSVMFHDKIVHPTMEFPFSKCIDLPAQQPGRRRKPKTTTEPTKTEEGEKTSSSQSTPSHMKDRTHSAQPSFCSLELLSDTSDEDGWSSEDEDMLEMLQKDTEDMLEMLQKDTEGPFSTIGKDEREMSSSDSDSTTTCLNSPVQEMEGSQGIKLESEEQDWPSECVMECELCGKISASVQIRPQNNGNKYRLELPCKGLFRCSETGIQFRVKSPLAIEYELLFWGDNIETIQQTIYIVGPLFNITVISEPGLVSEVYVPHYVCLKGGNTDILEMKIVHYKDDNMILESPTRVEPFYAVLENPTFSIIGAGIQKYFSKIFGRKIPIHGIVQLYCRYITGYTFHLYLMPQDHSLKKEVEKSENKHGFNEIKKPPLIRTVYSTNRYTVKGPITAEINPEVIEMCIDKLTVVNNYSEIYLSKMEDSVSIHLISSTDTLDGEDNVVWKTMLRKEDLRMTEQAVCEELISGEQKPAGGKHIMDKHRSELIARVSNIDPVLDDLLDDEILTQDQYDSVRSKSTSQEKMRELYDCARAWGDGEKEELFKAMEKHNQPLISDLKHKSIT